MLILLLHKPSKQSEHSGLRPDTSSLVLFYNQNVNIRTENSLIFNSKMQSKL